MNKMPLVILLLILGCSSNEDSQGAYFSYPNIIYILADDMGYGDVSAYNPSGKIKTPHIDRLAKEGMMFTDAHSPSAVCTPTRYGILTGRYAWRTWMKKGVLWSWDEPLIPPDRTTVASLLQKAGYHTACIGKWHLGLGWQKDSSGVVDITKPLSSGPTTIGFDYFWGITASLDIPPYIYIKNNQSTTQQIDSIGKNDGKGFWRTGQVGDDFAHEEVLPKLTEKALAYIDERASTKGPFFLYFPLPAPHTPILPTSKFAGKSNTNEYGDFVLMVDDLVGQIMKKLSDHKIADNTLIIFTTDNGCSPMADFDELTALGHQPGGIFRGHKADIYEGGHRVPFVARWPQQIAPGSQSDHTIALTDLLATAAAIVGDSLSSSSGEDSYNLLPLLQGNEPAGSFREATVHHSIEGAYAIRRGKWKLAFCPGSGGWSKPRPAEAHAAGLPPLQLFDLENDPGESNNLVDQHPQIVEELTALMKHYIDEGRSTPGVAQKNDTETKLFLN